MNIHDLIQRENWIKIEPLTKGWSKDIKFYIEDIHHQKFILRISDASLYDRKLKHFNLLKEIQELKINTPEPIEFGKLDDGRVYMILSFLDGEDAEKKVPTLNEKEQYLLGKKAGNILKKIHSIPIATESTWYDIYKAKIPRKISKAKDAPIKHKHLDVFIDYVLNHMHVVENNPMRLQHGDYHVGNMVVTKNLELGIIDFDKMDIADPIDDFKPFVWNVKKSSVFETGLIDGYYDNNIPDSFFKVFALYAAESCIGHIQWAITFGDEEVKTAIEVADQVYEWYQGFSLTIPTWYDKKLKDKYK